MSNFGGYQMVFMRVKGRKRHRKIVMKMMVGNAETGMEKVSAFKRRMEQKYRDILQRFFLCLKPKRTSN